MVADEVVMALDRHPFRGSLHGGDFNRITLGKPGLADIIGFDRMRTAGNQMRKDGPRQLIGQDDDENDCRKSPGMIEAHRPAGLVREFVHSPPDAADNCVVNPNNHRSCDRQPDQEMGVVEKRMFCQDWIPPGQQPDIEAFIGQEQTKEQDNVQYQYWKQQAVRHGQPHATPPSLRTADLPGGNPAQNRRSNDGNETQRRYYESSQRWKSAEMAEIPEEHGDEKERCQTSAHDSCVRQAWFVFGFRALVFEPRRAGNDCLNFCLEHAGLLVTAVRFFFQRVQNHFIEPHVDLHFCRWWLEFSQRQFAGEHFIKNHTQ